MASMIVMTGPQKDDYYPLGRRTNVVGRDEALFRKKPAFLGYTFTLQE